MTADSFHASLDAALTRQAPAPSEPDTLPVRRIWTLALLYCAVVWAPWVWLLVGGRL